MDRRSDHPGLNRPRGSRAWAQSIAFPVRPFLILAALFLLASALLAVPASAEVCENGRDPVTGQCQIGGGIPEPPPGGGGDDGGDGGESVPVGTVRTAERYVPPCDEVGVGCGVWAPCPNPDEELVNVYTRRERWDGTQWVPLTDWVLTPPPRCLPPDAEPARPTQQQVWDAIVEFGLPGGRTELNPPGGRTLINLPTNFYTTRGAIPPFDLDVAGFTVQIRATPESYEWHFGEGASRTTLYAGRPYPDGTIFHTYEHTGTHQVSVTVRYTVEWQFGGDGWQTIPAPIQAGDSPAVDLTVVESRSLLRADD